MRPKPYLHPVQLRERISRPQPKGLPVTNMGFNELPYPPLPGIQAALEDAAAKVQSYGSPHCDALRDGLANRHGLDPDHIICGNGSEELLDVIARCFARPGDEILISEFGYIQFELTANRVGATLVKAPETDLTADISSLLAAVTEHTRVLFLANPNNPTGTMVAVPDLARLAEGLRPDILLVLDLAYGEFADADYCAQVHDLVGLYENVLVTRTFSKAYGLAGARVGWCHGPEWIIPVLYAARGMGTVSALAQAAAVAGLAEQAGVDARIAEIVNERHRVAWELRRMGFATVLSHTNFLLATIGDGDAMQTEALVEHLFDEGGFIVNRTREAGLERYFRFSLSSPVANDGLIDCVRRFLER